MRHLHIFDPNLVDLGGHYFSYCAQVVREMRRRGMGVSIYARRGCEVTCEGITPEPVFSHDIFKEIGSDPEVWALENFHAVNQAFLADLARIPATRFAADDLLFFPTLNQNQLYAVSLWLARIPATQRPSVVVLLRYLTPEMEYNKVRKNREFLAHFYRYGGQSLLATQPRTVFCADTQEMAAAFTRIIGREVIEVSVAMEPPGSGPLPKRSLPERPLVVYQGHTSELKGFHLLPEIILACCRNIARRPRFVVQVQSRAQSRLLPILQWFERQPSSEIQLVEGAISSEEYFGLMSRADVVLLPYSLSYYGHCSSGIFAEAAALGKVIVVPEGTVAARQGRDYGLGIVPAKAWTAPAIADAIAVAVRDHAQLQARAIAAADRFRGDQSVRAFWDRLLGALTSAGPALAA